MSRPKKLRVGVLEYHQKPGSIEPEHHCGRAIADTLVRWHEARWIGKRVIQMVRGRAHDAIMQAKAARDAAIPIIRAILTNGPLGIGNVLPFSKPQSSGDKLHYATPMAGDNDLLHRFGMYFNARSNTYDTRTISVSSRSRFNVQVLP